MTVDDVKRFLNALPGDYELTGQERIFMGKVPEVIYAQPRGDSVELLLNFVYTTDGTRRRQGFYLTASPPRNGIVA